MKTNKMTIDEFEEKFKALFLEAMLSTEISYLELMEVNYRAMFSLLQVVRKMKDEGSEK